MRFYVLILGNIENHGLHLPDDVDFVISKHIAKRIIDEYPKIVSGSSEIKRGVGGIPPKDCFRLEEYQRVVKSKLIDILKNIDSVLIINSHYPNNAVIQQVIEELDLGYKKIVLVDVWNLIMSELNAMFEEEELGHGAKAETSLYVYATEAKIESCKNNLGSLKRYNKQKNKKYWTYPIKFSKNGVYGVVEGFSKETGKTISDTIFNKIKNVIQDEFNLLF